MTTGNETAAEPTDIARPRRSRRHAATTTKPTSPFTAFAEAREPPNGNWDRRSRRIATAFRSAALERFGLKRFVRRVSKLDPEFASLGKEGVRAAARQLRERLSVGSSDVGDVARAFALARRAAELTVGMRPFDVQIMGAWCLFRGMVAEMATGEGKTLTATIPACVAALSGEPVHIVTVNDYLALRDADWMEPVYNLLGLSVGRVASSVPHDERRAQYACDVTYCTNKELAFDYLRDRLRLGDARSPLHLTIDRFCGHTESGQRTALRGLHFAIVDEADSILIDEARVPLIISQPRPPLYDEEDYRRAFRIADSIEPGSHFVVDETTRTVCLSGEGMNEVDDLVSTAGWGGAVWEHRRIRHELLSQVLAAKYLYGSGRDYVVKSGAIEIVDENTGRTLPGRAWERGLQQAIEVKEGVELTSLNVPVARLSYQKLFRRYMRLAGMTGTAREVASEVAEIYDLATVRVPTHRPVARRHHGVRVVSIREEKWRAVSERVRGLHASGQPVLVGTRSVEDSEFLSRVLEDAGIPHRVLNARQDGEEANIVSAAGRLGQVTVATNMAGRGTDIALGDGVRDLGGLFVIATEFHDSRRVDRQLYGRSARQGDPGSSEAIVAVEDRMLREHGGFLVWFIERWSSRGGRAVPQGVARWAFRRAQRRAGRSHRKIRERLLLADEWITQTLSYTGTPE